jgi:hypothetical protein
MQKTMSAMIEQQEWPAYTGGVEQAGAGAKPSERLELYV